MSESQLCRLLAGTARIQSTHLDQIQEVFAIEKSEFFRRAESEAPDRAGLFARYGKGMMVCHRGGTGKSNYMANLFHFGNENPYRQ